MTVSQTALTGCNTDETTAQNMEGVPQKVVNPEGSDGSSEDTDINVYCEDKLRSLSEAELQTLVEVSEESIAKVLGGFVLVELSMNLAC